METVGPLRSPVKVCGALIWLAPGSRLARAIMLRPLMGNSGKRRESISVPSMLDRLSISGASAVTDMVSAMLPSASCASTRTFSVAVSSISLRRKTLNPCASTLTSYAPIGSSGST